MKYVLLLISLLVSQNSLACSCKETSVAAKYQEATEVLLGHVIEASEYVNKSNQNYPKGQVFVKAKYNLVESFKGSSSSSGVVFDRPFSSGNCSVLMTPGIKYIFFNYGSENISVCGGSQHYNPSTDKELIETLRSLRNEKDS